MTIREHIPLEQGLRHLAESFYDFFKCIIREHIPLEQGLRQDLDLLSNSLAFYQRAYSIRTRIKTKLTTIVTDLSLDQRAYSIRTRIKTFQKLS